MIIPQRIYFFWEGDKLSWLRYLALFSCRLQNPTLEIILVRLQPGVITISPIDERYNLYTGPDYSCLLYKLNIKTVWWTPPIKLLHRTIDVGELSNLIRWYYLGFYGGFYADMDILWVKPLESIYSYLNNKHIAWCSQNNRYLSIGFVGSTENKLFQDCYTKGLQYVYNNTHDTFQSLGIHLLNSLIGQERQGLVLTQPLLYRLRRIYKTLNFGILPYETIYPFNWQQTTQIFTEIQSIPEKTISIHWFGGELNVSAKWENILLHNNWFQYDNTFTSCLKQMM